MSLHIERRGDVAIVAPKGMFKGGKETEELETDLRRLVHDDQKKILLDLAATNHLSSTAIGVLASVHAGATKRGLRMHVCNIDKRIENVLTVVKLTRVLNVFNTREEAIAAFADA